MGDTHSVGSGSTWQKERGGGGHSCQAHRKMVANYAHCDKQGRSRGLGKAVCR